MTDGTGEISLEAAVAALRGHLARPESREGAARLLAPLLTPYAFVPDYRTCFRIWEEQRVHLTPVHFYSPIPDTRALTPEVLGRVSDLPGIDLNEAGQLALLAAFAQFREETDAFPHAPTAEPHAFHFANPMFSGTDALVLHSLVRLLRPRRVLEVGSGFSSRVTAAALLRNGGGELTCVEPYPDETLRAGFPGLTELVGLPVQAVPMERFTALEAGDILFIDSSHVVRTGGDVVHLYLEVLPRIAPGVVVHVHDIFLPGEYPAAWLTEKFTFWTEQYLLQAFLVGNRDVEVLLANSWLGRTHEDALREAFPTAPWWGAGGSFWFRRKPEDGRPVWAV